MDKLYTIIGIATFWTIIACIVIGIIIALCEEALVCLEVRRQVKHEIEAGKYYTHNKGKCWYSLNQLHNMPEYNTYIEIKWNQYYNFNLWTRLWMIGL